jgi:hypothetical protein
MDLRGCFHLLVSFRVSAYSEVTKVSASAYFICRTNELISVKFIWSPQKKFKGGNNLGSHWSNTTPSLCEAQIEH